MLLPDWLPCSMPCLGHAVSCRQENSRALAWQEPSSCDLSGKYFKPYDLKLLAHFLGMDHAGKKATELKGAAGLRNSEERHNTS